MYEDSFSETNFLLNTLISINFIPVIRESDFAGCEAGVPTQCVQRDFLTRYKKRKYKFDNNFMALEMHRDKDYYAIVNQIEVAKDTQ